MSNLLNRIEKSTKYVSDNSTYVKINYEVIDKVVESGEFDKVRYWLDTNPFNILDLGYRDLINFLLVYHTIGDYCFWGEPKWEIETEIGKLDGSYAIMYLLLERYKNRQDFNMSFDEFKELLKGNVEIPLLKERYECLSKMNEYLGSIAKDFYDEIRDLKDDTLLLDYIVNTFDYFNDECDYKNERIYFYKRAQLITSDILHVRKLLEGVEVDYSHLMGCADYKIPQVMRCLGMLEFSDELMEIVDNYQYIPYGDEKEIEIRANNLVVIDYIYNKMNGKVSRMDINDYIWLLGQDKSKMIKPYHRTRTIYY